MTSATLASAEAVSMLALRATSDSAAKAKQLKIFIVLTFAETRRQNKAQCHLINGKECDLNHCNRITSNGHPSASRRDRPYLCNRSMEKTGTRCPRLPPHGTSQYPKSRCAAI